MIAAEDLDPVSEEPIPAGKAVNAFADAVMFLKLSRCSKLAVARVEALGMAMARQLDDMAQRKP